MSAFLRDLRFALRGLARRPGFTVIALLTLILGVGVNTAVFSVVRAVVLKPLPFSEPDELVRVTGLNTASGVTSNISPGDFLDFQREARTFSRMGAHGWIGPATVSDGEGRAERLGRVEVTEGFFPALGVEPALGRLFTPEEDARGATPTAILSDGLWRTMFGGDPSIVGRSILVNFEPTVVVGVLPAGFRHLEERTDRGAEIFTSSVGFRFSIDPNNPASRGGRNIRAVGRLAPGSTIEQARSELTAIAERIEEEYPVGNANQRVYLAPLHEDVVGDAGQTLLILLGASGFVLLIACANLGNLLLAVGAGRERELAVRAALGAGRRRIVRQLLTECLVLGVAGGLGGALVAFASTGLLTHLSAAGIPRAADIRVDFIVLAFAAMTALVASVVFGLVPALSLSSGDVQGALTRGGRQGVGTVGRRSRDLLIAAEVALSVVLVAGAGLLVGTLLNLQGISTGFEPGRVISMEIAPPTARYPEGSQTAFQQAFEERASALPGVQAVGAVNILPLTDNYDSRGIFIEGRERPLPGRNPSAQARTVTPGYFEAMGMPLVRGRLFDARDREGSPLVIVISQSFAERFWPGEDPIGQRITYNSGIPALELRAACPELGDQYGQCIGGPGSREIIGVVGDVKHLDLREADPIPMFYTPNSQAPSYHTMTFVVRAQEDPTVLVGSLRAALAGIDPEVPLSQVQTLEDVLSQAVAQPKVRAGLIGMFAALAVLLAWVGVYGVVGYLVTRRTQEIGIRIALGAPAGQLLRMLARDGLRPVVIGIAAGIPVALAVTRVLQGMLFEVTHLHPAAYLFACGALVAAGLVATLVPARRALAVNPAIALSNA